MAVQILIIKGRLPGYNELKNKAWQASYRLKKEAMQEVQINASLQKIRPIKGKVEIAIACFEPNAKRDPDNVQAGANKIILDALQGMGILQGDGRKYIDLICPAVEVDKNKPRIKVEMREKK